MKDPVTQAQLIKHLELSIDWHRFDNEDFDGSKNIRLNKDPYLHHKDVERILNNMYETIDLLKKDLN